MEYIKPFPYKTEETATTVAGRMCHQDWRGIQENGVGPDGEKYSDPTFPHGP